MRATTHELVHSLRELAVFHGEKSSTEEVAALKVQAQGLGGLLCRWKGEEQASTGTLQLT